MKMPAKVLHGSSGKLPRTSEQLNCLGLLFVMVSDGENRALIFEICAVRKYRDFWATTPETHTSDGQTPTRGISNYTTTRKASF